MAYFPWNLGQQPMSSSRGVVIASDQTPVSVAGTVGASVIGRPPVAVTNIPSVSGTVEIGNTVTVTGTVGASVIGTVPATMAGAWTTSVVGTVTINPASVSGTVGASVIGTVPVIQSGTVISSISGTVTVASIVGTYAEDAAHTSTNPGLMTLGVRNDAVASIAGADLDYLPQGFDSAGRAITKPFAPDESRIFATASAVSAVSVLGVAAAGAGLRNYITDVMIANTGSVATLVTFTDGDASILGKTIAPAGGGSNIISMATPMRTSVNQPFNVVPGTASSVLHATIAGYKAP